MGLRHLATKPVSWLLACALAGAAGGLGAAYVVRSHTTASHKAVAGATPNDIALSTTLSVGTDVHGITDVYAAVSITNNGARPQPYIGISCFDPATVSFHSTRPVPAGPGYGASATALRAKIMDFRRSRDEVGYFQSADQAGSPASCDRTAVPQLPPHQTLRFAEKADIDLAGQFIIDAATTDIVTTVQLAEFPDPAHPTILQPTRTVEVRNPLLSVAGSSSASAADYALTSVRFDAAMNDPLIGPWVDAQDPSMWGDSRIEDAGPAKTWTLSAINLAWAAPLTVTGSGVVITRARIPHEKQVEPPTVAASLPPDTTASSTDYVLFNDYYAGDIELPSGLVMVGDPVSSEEMLKFDYGLKPGRYPVHLVTARPRYLGQDWERNAWETIALTGEPVTHWEPAIPVGHTKAELKPGDVFTWGTDGGEGGIASPEAMKLEDASLSSDPEMGLYDELTGREEANGWRYGIATVDTRSGANIFVCESGFGDGGYPVFLGLDAQGRPAALLSDFSVLEMTYSGIGAVTPP